MLIILAQPKSNLFLYLVDILKESVATARANPKTAVINLSIGEIDDIY